MIRCNAPGYAAAVGGAYLHLGADGVRLNPLDLPAVTREADILIAAIGRAGMIGADHVRDGAVVVDVGMNRLAEAAEAERLYPGDEERRRQFEFKGYILVGDVDFTRVAPKASHITPVPGGVGPLTVAMVIAGTLKASRRRQGLPAVP